MAAEAAAVIAAELSSALTAMPAEIRRHILDYIIPRGHCSSKYSGREVRLFLTERYIGVRDGNFATTTLYSDIPTPSRLSFRRFLKGVGSVNRQLHNDALALLYERTFIIMLDDSAFERRRQIGYCGSISEEIGLQCHWRTSFPASTSPPCASWR